jgi:hypothetical protein
MGIAPFQALQHCKGSGIKSCGEKGGWRQLAGHDRVLCSSASGGFKQVGELAEPQPDNVVDMPGNLPPGLPAKGESSDTFDAAFSSGLRQE